MSDILSADQAKRARRVIIKTLRSLEPTIERDQKFFGSAMVLLAAFMFGTSTPVLEQVTCRSAAFIEGVKRRLRQQRILRAGTIRVSWDDPEMGDWHVLFDAMVADGMVNRCIDPKVRAAGRAERAKRASEGRCVNCGGQSDDGQRTCAKCRRSVAASKAKQVSSVEGVYSPKVKTLNDSQKWLVLPEHDDVRRRARRERNQTYG